jgi:undecaprenyl-phosphate galactose phosphotransferase
MNWRSHQTLLNKLALLAGDAAALLAAFILGRAANWAYDHTLDEALFGWWGGLGQIRLALFSLALLTTLAWFWNAGHYSWRRPFWDEFQETLKILAMVATLDVALSFLGKWPFSRLWLLTTWSLAFLLVPLTRVLVKRTLLRLGAWQRQTVIIGAGENACEAAAALHSEPLMGLVVTALLDPDGNAGTPACVPPIRVLPLGDDPMALLRQMGYPHVIVALDADTLQDQQPLIRQLSIHYTDLNVIPSLPGLPLMGMETTHFFSHEVLLLRVRNNLARRGPRFFKRTMDILLSSFLLLVLLPVFAIVAWRIGREDGAPFIFSQPRIGRGGKPFRFYKFRSMINDADSLLEQWKTTHPELHAEYVDGNFKLKDDPRVLRVGKWIRRTSLDELPQLWNVLRGDMSLVGPRPMLEREIESYGDTFPLYRQARPGITGLWQISGRSKTTFLDRANLDAWYVKNWSLWYDIVILLKTVKVVLKRDGAY